MKFEIYFLRSPSLLLLIFLGVFFAIVTQWFVMASNEMKHYGSAYLVSDDGNNMWYNGPNAVHLQDEEMILAWFGDRRSAMLSHIDFNRNRILDHVAYEWHYRNDHSEPTIIQTDEEGTQIIAAFCLHNSPLMAGRFEFYRGFGSDPTHILDDGECTYPQLLKVGEEAFAIVYRRGRGDIAQTRDLAYVLSMDNGMTWSDAQVMIQAPVGGWIYAHSVVSKNSEISVAFGVFDPHSARIEDIHIAVFDLSSHLVGSQSGNSAKLPIQVSNQSLIYQTRVGFDARIWSYLIDFEGRHHMLLVDSISERSNLWLLEFADDLTLSSVLDLGAVGFRLYPCGAVFLGNPDTIVASRENASGRLGLYLMNVSDGNVHEQEIFSDIEGDLCRPEFLGGKKKLLSFTDVRSYESHLNFDTRLFVGSLADIGAAE